MASTIRRRLLVGFDPLDERLVDLDLVERKLPQIAHARIAGAKIVEHDAKAQRTERLANVQGRSGVFHEDPLGDFDLQTVRLQAGAFENCLDECHHIRLEKLHRRQVLATVYLAAAVIWWT